MGRPLHPGLSDPDRLALSQFLAGHLTAGQLSERLQSSQARPQSSEGPANRGRTRRRVIHAAVGGVVAAIAAAAVALAISSRPHVVAAHRATTGHSQPSDRNGSSRAVSDVRARSGPAHASAVTSGERIAVVGPATSSGHRVHKAKRPGRNRHKFRSSRPRHVRGAAPPAPTVTTPRSTAAGGSTPHHHHHHHATRDPDRPPPRPRGPRR